MAVGLTAAQLATAIRLGTTPDELATATRLLGVATEAVERHAPDAPTAIQDEAVIRLAGYLFDAPQAAQGAAHGDVLRNSGARALLLPYRIHRAGSTAEAVSEAQAAVGSPGNPVTNVTVSGSTLTISFADGTTRDETLPAGGPGGADQVARDAAAAANANATAAQRTADNAIVAIAALDDTYSTDAERTAAVTTLLAAIDALDGAGNGSGTKVYVDTQEPAGGTYRLDDVWIRDVDRLQIYKWTGTVWAVTFTLVEVPDVRLLSTGTPLPTATAVKFHANEVIAVDGQWFYIEQTGHLADTVSWTWADLNDGMVDLAGWRGVVAENPFSIPNPAVLDWAYITNEQRWVRRNASTWIYTSAPAAFNARYRTQNAAQTAGLVAVGKFIFDHNKHQMRIIRAYNGAVPGEPTYAWHAFQGEALNLETWAFRNEPIQVQARKLAIFPPAIINTIPNGGEKYFRLRARVHKNATGDLTSYDLAEWQPDVAVVGGSPQRWYDMAQLTAFTAVDWPMGNPRAAVLRSEGLARWADIAAIRAGLADYSIPQVVCMLSQSDETLFVANASNFMGSEGSNFRSRFVFNAGLVTVTFTSGGVMVDSGFAWPGAGRICVGLLG